MMVSSQHDWPALSFPYQTVESKGDIPAAFRRTEQGYAYELAIPAARLLPAPLRRGAAIGFGLFVNDADDAQGAASALTLTPPGTSCFNKPHLWPVLLLWE